MRAVVDAEGRNWSVGEVRRELLRWSIGGEDARWENAESRLHRDQVPAVAFAVARARDRFACRLVLCAALWALVLASPLIIEQLSWPDESWEMLIGPAALALAVGLISWCPVKALHDLQHETRYRVTARRTRLGAGLAGVTMLGGRPDHRWDSLPVVAYIAQVSRHVTVLVALDLDVTPAR